MLNGKYIPPYFWFIAPSWYRQCTKMQIVYLADVYIIIKASLNWLVMGEKVQVKGSRQIPWICSLQWTPFKRVYFEVSTFLYAFK